MSDKQIEAIRKGNVTWDEKLDTLVDFTCELVTNQGKVGPEMIGRFYQAGYTDACLVDLVMLVGMTTITNYLNNATWIPVDFPEGLRSSSVNVIVKVKFTNNLLFYIPI